MLGNQICSTQTIEEITNLTFKQKQNPNNTWNQSAKSLQCNYI